MNDKHLGSKFEDFLEEQDILQDCRASAIKFKNAREMQKAMSRQNIGKTADQMELPTPTAEEERFLEVVIEDWATRDPIQRAIATSVARGHDTVQKLAAHLRMEIVEVRRVLPTVWGILRDVTNDKFYFK